LAIAAYNFFLLHRSIDNNLSKNPHDYLSTQNNHMPAPITRRGNLLVAVSLLLLSIVFERFFIAPFFPMVEAVGSFRPMIVFLDIPLALPAIDWLPVSVLFSIFYAIVIGPSLSRMDPKGLPGEKGLLGRRIWKALTGWYLLLACIAAGGGLYYLVEAYLPKQVGNGIDSFGVRADLTLPYPSGELIHLHGSVIQLLFALLGLHLMARRTTMPQPVPSLAETSAIAETRAPAQTPSALQSRAVAEAQAIINTPPPKTPRTTIIKTPRREPVMADEPIAPPPSRRPAVAEEPIAPPPPRRSSVSVTPPPTTRTAVVQDRPAIVQDRPAHMPAAPVFPGEPPTCRLTTPPPIAIVMPRAAPGIGKVHPCFVIGSLKPTKRES
jgi:hypothetical protein